MTYLLHLIIAIVLLGPQNHLSVAFLKKIFRPFRSCNDKCKDDTVQRVSDCTYWCKTLSRGHYYDGTACWFFGKIGALFSSNGWCYDGICRPSYMNLTDSPAAKHCGIIDYDDKNTTHDTNESPSAPNASATTIIKHTTNTVEPGAAFTTLLNATSTVPESETAVGNWTDITDTTAHTNPTGPGYSGNTTFVSGETANSGSGTAVMYVSTRSLQEEHARSSTTRHLPPRQPPSSSNYSYVNTINYTQPTVEPPSFTANGNAIEGYTSPVAPLTSLSSTPTTETLSTTVVTALGSTRRHDTAERHVETSSSTGSRMGDTEVFTEFSNDTTTAQFSSPPTSVSMLSADATGSTDTIHDGDKEGTALEDTTDDGHRKPCGKHNAESQKHKEHFSVDVNVALRVGTAKESKMNVSVNVWAPKSIINVTVVNKGGSGR